ncbi:hypothetical protein Barb7_02827 [Bacteroidales bacterium Barb7]|nr:hypothetical protein Barb7_02827 [Bacteroidales bacterium Barb7]
MLSPIFSGFMDMSLTITTGVRLAYPSALNIKSKLSPGAKIRGSLRVVLKISTPRSDRIVTVCLW